MPRTDLHGNPLHLFGKFNQRGMHGKKWEKVDMGGGGGASGSVGELA